MFRDNYTVKRFDQIKTNGVDTEAKTLRDEIASNKLKQEQLRSMIAKLTKEVNSLDDANVTIEKRIKNTVRYDDSELSEFVNKSFYSYSDKGHACVVDNETRTLSIYFYAPDTTKERFIKLIKNIDKDVIVQADPNSPRGAVIVITNLQNRNAICKKLANYDALQAIVDFENTPAEDYTSIRLKS